MTQRKNNLAFFYFYCIFRIFGMRGVHCTIKMKNICLEVLSFVQKFGTFQAFLQHVLTGQLVSVLLQPFLSPPISHLSNVYFSQSHTHYTPKIEIFVG